jgi:archaellum component FlaC
MSDVQDLEGRVSALEAAQNDTTKTLRWVVAKLGGIASQQDEHTLQLERIDSRLGGIDKRLDGIDKRFDGVDKRLDGVDSRLGRVEAGLDGLRRDLPCIVADALREVLKAGGA